MQAFIARQPIVDAAQKLYAYELLYRDSSENKYPQKMDGTKATKTIVSLMNTEFDLQKLTDGKYVFINFTEELFLSKLNELLDAERVIIEILETIVPNERIVESVRELKDKGYSLALDDYTGEASVFTEMADIIKVDFPMTPPETRKRIAQTYTNKILLAEKIETEEDFEMAKRLNYKLFQGYYFSRPILLTVETVEIAMSSYQRLWMLVNQPELDFTKLTETINLDANLAYKLILKINTLQYYRGSQVQSIKAALIRMGQVELKRWVLLLLMRECFGEKGALSAKLALTRAIFCEKLTLLIRHDYLREDAYIVGLLSNIETLEMEDWNDILNRLFISKVAQAAVKGESCLLTEIVEVAKHYQAADWDEVLEFMNKYKIDSSDLISLYLTALQQAELAFEG